MVLSLGEKLRLMREDKEISQEELGRFVNMSQRKISYIECGKYEPNIQDIQEICRYFKVSADYFLNLPQGMKYPKSRYNK